MEARKRLVREMEIVSILTLAGHEADIFRPLDRLPDTEFHRCNPISNLLRLADAKTLVKPANRADLVLVTRIDAVAFAAKRRPWHPWRPCEGVFSGTPWFGQFVAAPPASARTCIEQARSRKNMRMKASAQVFPIASVPWLRKIIRCLSPMSARSRSRSLRSSAMPS